MMPSVSGAATITVNSNADNNGAGCTLREAIVSANTSVNQNNGCAVGSNSGTDTITFSNSLPSNIINLSNEELSVGAGKDIEINASTITGGVTIDASQTTSRVISATSASLVLDNLILTGGEEDTDSSFAGGGIYANASTVTLSNSTVTGNSAFLRGGGIFASNSTLNLYHSSVNNNRTTGGEYSYAIGGGIYAREASNVTLNNSTVTGNSSFVTAGVYARDTDVTINYSTLSDNVSAGGEYGGDGSGLFIRGSVSLMMNNSTVSNNTNTGRGAGLVVRSGATAIINNSTITGNSAGNLGGGIFGYDTSTSITLNNSTVSGNSANRGGGIFHFRNTMTLNNTTLSDNTAATGAGFYGSSGSLTLNNSIIANSMGDDCHDNSAFPVLMIDSATIVEDGSCNANRSGDPGLLDLADNGGPTLTHALAPNSIAINTGDAATCLATDQLGKTRDISDGFCDVGALEFDASLVNDTTTFVIPLANGKTVIFDL